MFIELLRLIISPLSVHPLFGPTGGQPVPLSHKLWVGETYLKPDTIFGTSTIFPTVYPPKAANQLSLETISAVPSHKDLIT